TMTAASPTRSPWTEPSSLIFAVLVELLSMTASPETSRVEPSPYFAVRRIAGCEIPPTTIGMSPRIPGAIASGLSHLREIRFPVLQQPLEQLSLGDRPVSAGQQFDERLRRVTGCLSPCGILGQGQPLPDKQAENQWFQNQPHWSTPFSFTAKWFTRQAAL
ncbi:MAG: hypothetical protein MK138_15605, partial [Planctomycetes bacterium]|nr:hypothetical protein [Planctomycetota bacterium]